MPLDEAWRALHASRFPELPLDCGNSDDPGIIYSEDLRDWSDKATTPDQARMERYIDRYNLTSRRILHIGIGNSGLAKRFHSRVGEILGTTIDEPELRVARSLHFANYRVELQNKFSGRGDALDGRFDFILDNNPTSPCCCISHLAALLNMYEAKLVCDGQIVTDAEGLSWVPDDSHPRWSFDFDDLAAIGTTVGLSAFKVRRSVYVLSRSAPPPPGGRALARHVFRRARALPFKLIVSGPKEVARLGHKSLKWLLARVPSPLAARYRSRS